MAHHILQHFAYRHTPLVPTEIVKPYESLAYSLDKLLDEGPEKNIALIKLLESCDMAIRSYLMDAENHARDEKIAELTEVLYPKKEQGRIPGQRAPLSHKPHPSNR